MSDFTNNFWSVYVAAITVISIVACLLLLWFSGKARAMTADDNTTGHVWDGDLREMNNPLPRWWAWLFVITIVFALGVPGRCTPVWVATRARWVGPRLGELTRPKWTAGELEAVAPLYAKFAAMTPEAIAGGPPSPGYWRAPFHEQLFAMPRV